MDDTEIVWEGRSGKEYLYWIHRVGTSFNDEAGNYIYAREVEPDAWIALYVGHTSNLQGRLASEEGVAWARQNGATHLHVHTTPGGEARGLIEQADLIARWKPVYNPFPEGPDHDAQPTGSPR